MKKSNKQTKKPHLLILILSTKYFSKYLNSRVGNCVTLRVKVCTFRVTDLPSDNTAALFFPAFSSHQDLIPSTTAASFTLGKWLEIKP